MAGQKVEKGMKAWEKRGGKKKNNERPRDEQWRNEESALYARDTRP